MMLANEVVSVVVGLLVAVVQTAGGNSAWWHCGRCSG